MKKLVYVLIAVSLVLVLLPAAATTMFAEGEGCTPGYWKQDHHELSWVGYARDNSYSVVFGVAGYDNTLLGALETGGGGENALGRHAVAALLNASNGDVGYSYTVAEVIGIVQVAYANDDFETAKDLLEEQNELDCPLGREAAPGGE
jgi:hypothetical protein